MSALGQKQTSENVRLMSALPPKADIRTQSGNVRFVPKADLPMVEMPFDIFPASMADVGIILAPLPL
jgi:hypothetical protein